MSNIQFPNKVLGPGTFTATVVDNNGDPATVLEAGLEFKVETEWEIDAVSALLLGGQWEVTTYAESIGPGAEVRIGSTTTPLTGAQKYKAVVTVPAGTLPNDPGQPVAGAYKLVTVLVLRNFGKITNVAALVEGPVVRIG